MTDQSKESLNDQIQAIIALTRHMIDSGHSSIEITQYQNEKRSVGGRFFFPATPPEMDPGATQPRYLFRVHNNEPVEVSLARRLITKDVDFYAAERLGHPEVVSQIKNIQALSEKALGESLDKEAAFDQSLKEIYTVPVEIYTFKTPRADPDGIFFRAGMGWSDAVMDLDSKGLYVKVATMTVADQFDTAKTLEQVFEQGQNEGRSWGTADNVKAEGFGGGLHSISTGHVLKVNGEAHVVAGVGYKQLEGFVGKTPEQRLSRSNDQSGPSM